jgi:archaeal type IV pilus assembly protein PilA
LTIHNINHIGGYKNLNYMRKLKKNSKALSPVVASIILIAVTVAVSVVVAAWMGGTTIGLMGTAEQISITNVAFPDANTIRVLVQNAGGTQGTITSAFINGAQVAITETGGTIAVAKSSQTTIDFVSGTNGTALAGGSSYVVKLITQQGTSVISPASVYSPDV